MKKINKYKRNYIIVGLCTILLIMFVSYAAFASQLKINGTSNIRSSFLVKITNITVSNILGSAEDKKDVTTYDDTSATFGVNLVSPGDSITYNIIIENQGSIDAVLTTINKTNTSNDAIIFETSGVNEGDELKAGEIATMQVKVTYNPKVTTQPTNLENKLILNLQYAQSGTEVTPSTNKLLFATQSVEIVETGDGLYASAYGDERYFYKGSNPNNYITFNNELWRIISIENNGMIKIMKNESIGNMAFDSTNSNNWDRPSDIKTYLNETYLNEIKTNQDKIISHTWSVGPVTLNNTDLNKQIEDENNILSKNAKVGMITVSEYLRANSNIEACENMNVNNTNRETCLLTNWMYSLISNGSILCTISPTTSSDNLFNIRAVSSLAGNIYLNLANDLSYSHIPVLYLTSNIELSGNGTLSNPYIITN